LCFLRGRHCLVSRPTMYISVRLRRICIFKVVLVSLKDFCFYIAVTLYIKLLFFVRVRKYSVSVGTTISWCFKSCFLITLTNWATKHEETLSESVGTFWTFEKRNSKHATTETFQNFTFHSDSTTVISKVEGVQHSPCNLSTFSLSFWNQSGLQASCGTNRIYAGRQNIKNKVWNEKLKATRRMGYERSKRNRKSQLDFLTTTAHILSIIHKLM
jgi:hypothetical protein